MSIKYLDIGAAADEVYALPLAVMLHSAASHLPSQTILRAWVIESNICTHTKQRIESMLKRLNPENEVNWLTLDTSRYDCLHTRGHLTKECFYRLLFPEHLTSLDTLLYLDCDIIVNCDLTELFNRLPFQGENIIGAVQGYGAPFAYNERGIPNYESLGIDRMSPVFNSGVMLIDLKKWREFEVTRKSLEIASGPMNEHLIENDQTTLNIVLHRKWEVMEPTWNVMHPIYYWEKWLNSPHKDQIKPLVKDLIDQPSILHYTSHSKPWHRDCNHPLAKLFLNYLKSSGWFKNHLQYWWWMKTRKPWQGH